MNDNEEDMAAYNGGLKVSYNNGGITNTSEQCHLLADEWRQRAVLAETEAKAVADGQKMAQEQHVAMLQSMFEEQQKQEQQQAAAYAVAASTAGPMPMQAVEYSCGSMIPQTMGLMIGGQSGMGTGAQGQHGMAHGVPCFTMQGARDTTVYGQYGSGQSTMPNVSPQAFSVPQGLPYGPYAALQGVSGW